MTEAGDETSTVSSSAVVVSYDDAGGATALAALVGRVDSAIRLGQTVLVVDLGGREGADADLLGVLHRSGRWMRDAGGRLAVVCGDSRLRRLLDLTLLSQGFGVYATREEALAGS